MNNDHIQHYIYKLILPLLFGRPEICFFWNHLVFRINIIVHFCSCFKLKKNFQISLLIFIFNFFYDLLWPCVSCIIVGSASEPRPILWIECFWWLYWKIWKIRRILICFFEIFARFLVLLVGNKVKGAALRHIVRIFVKWLNKAVSRRIYVAWKLSLCLRRLGRKPSLWVREVVRKVLEVKIQLVIEFVCCRNVFWYNEWT